MSVVSRFDRRVSINQDFYTIFNQMHGGNKKETHQAINQALSEFIQGRIQIFDKATAIVNHVQQSQPITKKRSVPSSWLEWLDTQSHWLIMSKPLLQASWNTQKSIALRSNPSQVDKDEIHNLERVFKSSESSDDLNGMKRCLYRLQEFINDV